MILVFGGAAVEAKGIGITIQAIHIAFAPGGVAVSPAHIEESGVEKLLQPRRNVQHCVLPYTTQQTIFLFTTFNTFSFYLQSLRQDLEREIN